MRRRVAATLALLLGLAVVGGPGGAAGAQAAVPAPPDGTWRVRGHGWGHGVGMSQYGALGGAQAGRTAAQIVGFYYPGTTLTSIGNPVLRVKVASLGSAIPAAPATGLSLTYDGSVLTQLPTSLGAVAITGWRLVADPTAGSSRVRVEYLLSGSTTWALHAVSPGSQAGFRNDARGVVATTRAGTTVTYRGELRAVRTAADGPLVPVVALPMESYLLSVVPSEMPSSWPAAAVQAQAIAARSFAEFHRRYAPLSAAWYDVYDDTRSQVFRGTAVGGGTVEQTASTAAVAGTAGQAVLDAAGRIGFTQFSSSNGGWTVAGSQPYLVAQEDTWDGVSANPNHTWEVDLTTASIERAYPSVGSLRSIDITRRDGNGDLGGRVQELVVTGSTGSVTVTGRGFCAALGLRSDWFDLLSEASVPSFPRDVTGDGEADVVARVAATGELRIYPRRGTTWWPAVSVGTGYSGYRLVATAGTFDGDALSDLVLVTTTGTAYLQRAQGSGTFGSRTVLATTWADYDLVFPLGDFDGDGVTDLMTRTTGGALVLQRGTGAGQILATRQVGSGWAAFTAVFSPGDLTGDGHPDVLARDALGDLYAYPGNGAGGWLRRVKVGTGWQSMTALLGVGDMNGDWVGGDVLARTAAGELYVYPANGSGGFLRPQRIGTGWGGFSTILP